MEFLNNYLYLCLYNLRVMKPEGDEAKELEEILAKRQKKGKVDDDKPLEEKSIFHSKNIF